MITIDEITIIRDGREIIYDYSEQIPAGSITVIVGPNGSGKSTLLAAIAGDIAPAKGTITIDDHHPILTAPETLARMRSMVIQNQNFSVGFTVREIIEMAGPAEEIMKSLKIEQLADRFVTTLSGGEAQRVAIAQAIAQDIPADKRGHQCGRVEGLVDLKVFLIDVRTQAARKNAPDVV